MKKISILTTALLLGACQAQQSSDEFTIDVTLDSPYSGKVYLSHITDRYTMLDSIELKEATTFSFSGKLTEADDYRIASRPLGFDMNVIVEPGGKYEVTVTDKKPVIEVKSGEEQLIMNEYLDYIRPFKEQENILGDSYIKTEEDAAKEALQKQMSQLFQDKEKATIEFILKHADTYTATLLAGNLLLYTYPQLEEIYQQLDKERFQNAVGLKRFMEKYTETKNKWIQGTPAPDFTTKDLKGQTVKLSDFKGKYVLLDFWASWCRPCRNKAKELKKILPELEKRGIRICGLSMDEKREQWTKATEEDQIVWTNTGEVVPFKDNPIAASYKVQQLPTLFLIDPEGKVAIQNPTIEDLLALPMQP